MTKAHVWFQAYSKGAGAAHRPVTIHAKEYGTVFTVCGQSAMSMEKHWDRVFDAEDRSACIRCRSIATPMSSARVGG